MIQFERVKRFEGDESIPLPTRATTDSAGYDLCAAENIIVYPYEELMDKISDNASALVSLQPIFIDREERGLKYKERVYTLDEMNIVTKQLNARPTLVPTGIKCKMESGMYLNIAPRSSTPLKYWLVLANSQGIIDADYYGNPDNDGEIYVQLINFSPVPILIQKGEKIAQGIFHEYKKIEDDVADGTREGGLGSTTEVSENDPRS